MNSGIEIFHAGPGQASRVAEVARLTFYETWHESNTEADMEAYLADAFSIERIQVELADPVNTFLLAFSGNDTAGYAKMRRDRTPSQWSPSETIEIERMYVKRSYQSRHLGAALMNRCLELSLAEKRRKVWLGVDVKNLKAIAFYKRFGFVIFGTKQFRLGDAVNDDHLMMLDLRPPGDGISS